MAMILKSVRIENFKCIEDSGEFSIEPVTCLVGKNESGKTTLLEALYKIKPDIQEKSNFEHIMDYPRRKLSEYKERHSTRPDNVLTTIWELDSTEIDLLNQKLGKGVLGSKTVTVKKGYDNKYYYHIEIDEQQVITYYLKNAELSSEELDSLEGAKTVTELFNKLKTKESPSENQAKLLKTLTAIFPEGNLSKVTNDIMQKCLPTFLYFDDYYTLAGQVSINDLRKRKEEKRLEPSHRVFLSLLDLVGTSPDEIDRISRYEELIAELEAVSNRLSEEIFNYWSQNKHLEVVFNFDHGRLGDPPPFNEGYVFHTRIKNKRHGVTVSFGKRSAGFIWFFSFLVWFSQIKKNYGENLIILLDDPALSLHARAQADLLRYINEKLKPHHQVIYTTHSPFMIDPENLLCVRTVEDIVIDEKILGTKVGDEVLSTDADTVFPLQAALGYDITQTLFVGKHTLLVEGPSDLLYLKWFSKQLQERGKHYLDSRWVISPCGGVDKISSFIALFGGSKLHAAVFTDFHAGLKGKIRGLRESDLLRKGHVFSAEMYIDQTEADIEDVMGRYFYITLVNECYSLDGPHRLIETKPPDAPIRVLEKVEKHFATLPTTVPEFDHYKPASFLVESTDKLLTILPGLDQALDRFEKLFRDLNKLLTE